MVQCTLPWWCHQVTCDNCCDVMMHCWSLSSPGWKLLCCVHYGTTRVPLQRPLRDKGLLESVVIVLRNVNWLTYFLYCDNLCYVSDLSFCFLLLVFMSHILTVCCAAMLSSSAKISAAFRSLVTLPREVAVAVRLAGASSQETQPNGCPHAAWGGGAVVFQTWRMCGSARVGNHPVSLEAGYTCCHCLRSCWRRS